MSTTILSMGNTRPGPARIDGRNKPVRPKSTFWAQQQATAIRRTASETTRSDHPLLEMQLSTQRSRSKEESVSRQNSGNLLGQDLTAWASEYGMDLNDDDSYLELDVYIQSHHPSSKSRRNSNSGSGGSGARVTLPHRRNSVEKDANGVAKTNAKQRRKSLTETTTAV